MDIHQTDAGVLFRVFTGKLDFCEK